MTPRSDPLEMIRSASRRMTRIGWVALAVLLFALFLAITGGYRVIQSLFVSGSDLEQAAASQSEGVAKFNESFDLPLKQIAGRTLFHRPIEPKEPEEPKDEPKPDGPAPPPTRYAGPAIIAMIDKTVFFDDGRRLSVGDEPDNGLEVIEPRGPWSAVLRWRGVEFEVQLFERTTRDFLKEPESESEKD
jgi:hypothetical protein